MAKRIESISETEQLRAKIAELEEEVRLLKSKQAITDKETVFVPENLKEIFDVAQEQVGAYFGDLHFVPEEGTIHIGEERYVLVRAGALSHEFLNMIKGLYSDRGDQEAIDIGRSFLFDMAHVIGMEDAKNFHAKMDLKSPLERLAAGPVHFAYSGWANVEFLEGNPTPDENYFIKYRHPYSFEADSWIKAGKKSDNTVCIMNAGYSSGWCSQSFGIPLTAVELTCKAKGDEHCTFIMAPPDRIEEYLAKEKVEQPVVYDIPIFFHRKKVEEQLKASLEEKDVLLKEVHHRVKNNLQIVSSLIKLQLEYISDNGVRELFDVVQNRIKTMALVHEKLYKTNIVQFVDMPGYLMSVVELTMETFGTPCQIELKSEFGDDVERFKLDQAIPIGLIVQELVANSLKHAFQGYSEGELYISLHRLDEETMRLTLADNGVGFPDKENCGFKNSFGLELVEMLIAQIDGQPHITSTSGIRFEIDFPLK